MHCSDGNADAAAAEDTFFPHHLEIGITLAEQFFFFAFPASHPIGIAPIDSIRLTQLAKYKSIIYLYSFILFNHVAEFLYVVPLPVVLLGLSLWKWDWVKCSRAYTYTCRRNIIIIATNFIWMPFAALLNFCAQHCIAFYYTIGITFSFIRFEQAWVWHAHHFDE